MATNNLQLMAIPELSGLHFFIPDYQRGYRWEKDQIYALLKDLWRYFHSDNKFQFYCLQPIVVKECNAETIYKYNLPDISDQPEYINNSGGGDDSQGGQPKHNVWYEVIDGQQRLTTIRILIECYKSEWRGFKDIPFELRYATRDGLHEIFNNLEIDLKNASVSINPAFKRVDYVDVEYIKDCVQHIINWFNDDDEVEENKYNDMYVFLPNFYKAQGKDYSVQVIWYETFEKTDARDIFERLNDLQVPLSSSELIRAIFLSKNAVYDPRQLDIATPPDELKLILKDKEAKQSSINAKWDEIEHYFSNGDVWAFITNKKAKNYRNRIELLFDLMSQKDISGKDDRLFTYLWFEDKIEKESWNLWDLWQEIVKNYETIRFWYEDRNYYHKIGFLIHEKDGTKALPILLKDANYGAMKKSEFDNKLHEMIKSVIQKQSDPALSALSYDTPSDKGKLKNVLLLYNVELTNQSPAIEARFPFKDYKAQEGVDENDKQKRGWTLEHIHAQNSECLNPSDRTEWIDWAKFTLKARKELQHPTMEELDYVKELEDLLQRDSTGKCKMEDENNFKYARDLVPLFQKDLDLWARGKPNVIKHQLSNLALLSGEINSSIGKGSFFVKQQRINKCIADGEYVPIATQKVFLKHYYPASSTNELLSRQLLTWEKEDRDNYLQSIKDVLKEYGFTF